MVKIKLNPKIKKDYLRLKTREKYLVITNRYEDFRSEETEMLKKQFGNSIVIDGEEPKKDIIEEKSEIQEKPNETVSKKKKKKFKIF